MRSRDSANISAGVRHIFQIECVPPGDGDGDLDAIRRHARELVPFCGQGSNDKGEKINPDSKTARLAIDWTGATLNPQRYPA